MLRRSLLIGLLLPLCAHVALADAWLRMQTANFELFTDAGEKTGREILTQFERVHSFFELAYSNKKTNPKPVCLIAFQSAKEYQLYRPNEVATAYFQSGNERDFIVMAAGVIGAGRVPVHEYTHLMIHQSGQRIPVWLNEGTADLFSTMEARGAKVQVGNVIPGHLGTLAREKWIGLEALLAADHTSPLYNEKNQASVFYAESWLLAHMLNLDLAYRPHLREFTAALQQNGAAAAFEAAYQKSVAEVEADLHRYFQLKRVNGLLFPVQLPKSADDPEIQPAATFSIRLALAELVADTPQKRDQARAAYFGLARDYPDQWEVEAGLAQLYWRERDGAEAAKYYARALEMGCKDQHAYIEYGRVLGFIRREKEAAGILRSAVQFDSTNQEAHYELAIALTGSGEYQAALAEFKTVRQIAQQEAVRYSYFLAYALYRDGQLPQARTMLERGKPFVTTEQERSNYAGLSAALEAKVAGAAPGSVHRNAETMEGQFTRFDCTGKQAVLHLNVNGAEEVFTIESLDKLTIRSGSAAPVTFPCGPQKNQALLVEYREIKDEAGKVAHLAVALEFR